MTKIHGLDFLFLTFWYSVRLYIYLRKQFARCAPAKLTKTDKMSNEIKENDFIKAYILRRGKVCDACKDAGISRETYYTWRKTKPEFAQKLKDAIDQVNDIRLELANAVLYEELEREYENRKSGAGVMRDNDLLGYIKLQMQVTPMGKEMLGITPAPPDTQAPDVVAITKILQSQAEKAIFETPPPYTDDGTENDTNQNSD